MPRIDLSEEAKFCFFYYKVVETYSILALLQSYRNGNDILEEGKFVIKNITRILDRQSVRNRSHSLCDYPLESRAINLGFPVLLTLPRSYHPISLPLFKRHFPLCFY